MQLHDASVLLNQDSKQQLVGYRAEKEDDPKEFEHKCSICLEMIAERTQPVTCKHVYCMECIYGWTKYSNVCPLCKVPITQLQIFNALKPEEVHEVIEVPEP